MLKQRYESLEVIVVDDRSEDATAEIVQKIACEDRCLNLIAGEPLPQGWVGKPWALQQGAAQAKGQWLLFTDADTEHEPDATAAAVAYARENAIDVLSLLTDQVTVTAAERLLLPSILWTIIFATGSLAAINDPKSDAALFNGQYILMSREVHDAIGGHALVKGEIAEDLELCRRLKAGGRFRVALVAAPALVRTRMYRSFGEIWNGFIKNFAIGARGRTVQATLGIAFFAAIAPVTPVAFAVALARQWWGSAALAGGSMALSMGAAEFAMRQSRFRPGSGLALPLGITAMVAIFCASVVQHARGGVTWRGRRY